jgi:hypothetical protein
MEGFMKIIAIFLAIFLINITYICSDENSNELKNITFSWQLCNNGIESTSIDFMDLNPLFFNNGNSYFSLNTFEHNNQNNGTRNEEEKYITAQDGNNWLGFLLGIAIYSIIWTNAYKNPQSQKYLNEVWEKKFEEDKLYQRIIKNYNEKY